MKKEDIKAQVTLVMCEFLYIRKCDAAEVKKNRLQILRSIQTKKLNFILYNCIAHTGKNIM